MARELDKKKAIFESTIQLVNANGFHGTPMSLIAKKAGVAAGTIYLYFDSKDTLMIELYSYLRCKMVDAMLVNDTDRMEYKDRFFNFWINHCRFYIHHPEALCFLEQYTNSPYGTQQSSLQKDDARFESIIREFTRTGIKTGVLKDVDHHLLGMFIHSSVISTAKIHLRKFNMTDEELKQVACIVWDGIKK